MTVSRVLVGEDDLPAVFLVYLSADAPRVVAGLSLNKLRDLRRFIAFGEKGHAAIVDHQGNIVSHPRADWEAAIKNLAMVEPVKMMIAGKTGISRFILRPQTWI
ncbi:MAG: hypothetical protein VW268_01695 [Rhodospirillaceae bacterium]